MYDYQFGSSGSEGYRPFGSSGSEHPDKHSAFSLIVLIAIVAVAAVLVIGTGFWLLGLVFGIAGWIIRIAILAAVAAFVWRRVTGRRCRDRV